LDAGLDAYKAQAMESWSLLLTVYFILEYTWLKVVYYIFCY
jgi:hypothetical protein